MEEEIQEVFVSRQDVSKFLFKFISYILDFQIKNRKSLCEQVRGVPIPERRDLKTSNEQREVPPYERETLLAYSRKLRPQRRNDQPQKAIWNGHSKSETDKQRFEWVNRWFDPLKHQSF